MKKKDYIQREVDRTMRSLDEVKRAETDPYFYARLDARLSAGLDKKRVVSPVQGRWQLGLGWAAMVLVLINVFSILSYTYYEREDGLESRGYYLEEIYQDYELAAHTIYEAPLNDQ